MKKYSFHKGLLPLDDLSFKSSKVLSQERVLENFSPREVVIPMQQHVGKPAIPIVKKDDFVAIGQMIARPDSLYSCAMHASVSGQVISIDQITLPNNELTLAIHIRNDLKRRMDTSVRKHSFSEDLSSKELQRFLANSGIVGMGGKGFPTLAKCLKAIQKNVDTLVVNACESEPFLTCDAFLMREHAKAIIHGAIALSGVCKINKIVFAIQDKWLVEISQLETEIEFLRKDYIGREFSIAIIKSRFPQGQERLLIKAIYGQSLTWQQNPEDAGKIVFNVATCAAFWNQIDKNMPLTSRVITIAGDNIINRNIMVPIGTMVSELLAYIPGVNSYKRLAMGGAMTGRLLTSLDVPITKITQGITLIKEEEENRGDCMQCGACIEACPVDLKPNFLARLIFLNSPAMQEKNKTTTVNDFEGRNFTKEERDRFFSLMVDLNVPECLACGACSYVCPSNLNLSSLIGFKSLEVRSWIRANR